MVTSQLTLAGAQVIIDACVTSATKSKLGAFNISVCDASTNEIAFARMPGAKITSIDIARGKAFTSAGHKAPTRKFASYAGVNGPAFGLHVTNGGRFSIVPGGLPIVDGSREVIGSVGVSGGSPDQDEEVARAGVVALARFRVSKL